jgi:hypothetical protein
VASEITGVDDDAEDVTATDGANIGGGNGGTSDDNGNGGMSEAHAGDIDDKYIARGDDNNGDDVIAANEVTGDDNGDDRDTKPDIGVRVSGNKRENADSHEGGANENDAKGDTSGDDEYDEDDDGDEDDDDDDDDEDDDGNDEDEEEDGKDEDEDDGDGDGDDDDGDDDGINEGPRTGERDTGLVIFAAMWDASLRRQGGMLPPFIRETSCSESFLLRQFFSTTKGNVGGSEVGRGMTNAKEGGEITVRFSEGEIEEDGGGADGNGDREGGVDVCADEEGGSDGDDSHGDGDDDNGDGDREFDWDSDDDDAGITASARGGGVCCSATGAEGGGSAGGTGTG